MRSLLLSLMLILPVSAATPAAGAFFGAGVGSSGSYDVDLAMVAGRSGASAWGLHAGYIGRSTGGSPSGSGGYTSSGPSTTTSTTGFGGLQLGFYFDAGRAFWALGAEHLTNTVQTTVVNLDHSTTTSPEVQQGGVGGYLKLGYKIGSFTIYGGYGTQTKAMVGLGINF